MQVLARTDSSDPNKLMGLLAAGPLEELLVLNGTTVLESIDALARREPVFRRLLDGVCGDAIDPNAREALAKYRKVPW